MMSKVATLLLLCISTSIAAPPVTTWQLACNGTPQHIPVNLNDSFIYPAPNAVVPNPLQNDCTLLFNPMPGVAMHLVITGAYSNNSIKVTTLDPGNTITVQTLQNYEIIPSGALVTIKIDHTLAASGPLTIQVAGHQVGLNAKPMAVTNKAYQTIYSTDYSTQTADPTFAVTSPIGNTLTFFFCLHPSASQASQGRFIFYTSDNKYLTNGAQFATNSRAYSSAKQNVNIFYDIDPTFIGQVIAYATDNNADFTKYTSAIWEGQATVAPGSALVVGRQNNQATPGVISINWGSSTSQIVIYAGIVELQNLPNNGLTVSANVTMVPITQPVITVIATKGSATLTFSPQTPPTTTAAPATTATKIPITTSVGSSLSYTLFAITSLISLLSK